MLNSISVGKPTPILIHRQQSKSVSVPLRPLESPGPCGAAFADPILAQGPVFFLVRFIAVQQGRQCTCYSEAGHPSPCLRYPIFRLRVPFEPAARSFSFLSAGNPPPCSPSTTHLRFAFPLVQCSRYAFYENISTDRVSLKIGRSSSEHSRAQCGS